MSVLERLGIDNKINLDDLYNRFLGLEKEQQTLVMVGLGVVVILLLSLPVYVVSSQLGKTEKQYRKVAEKASQFYALVDDYHDIQKDVDVQKKNSESLGIDPLRKILDEVSKNLNIDPKKMNLKTISPVPSSLYTELSKDVTVSSIGFDEMVQLVAQLTQYKGARLHIKKLVAQADQKNRQMMKSVSFTLSMMKPN